MSKVSKTFKAIRLTVVALAAFTGLAGVAAAIAVRQVPAGERLEFEGRIYDDGLIIAPVWIEATRLPPADPPAVAVPPAPSAEDPRAALDSRLEGARAELTAAEEQAVEHNRASDSAFADVERAHLDALTRAEIELEQRIAALEAEAGETPARRAAEADADATILLAEGRAAVARAEAARDQALAEALSGEAARYYIAIEAARRFELGDVHLPNPPPDFLEALGGLDSWRRFFLGRR